ncbi:MAG TPA: hypothetical protein ENI27_00225 [bacterium]|nr:hypothetical protein [bacterium]
MGCITQDYKTLLVEMIDGDTSRELLKEFVKIFALCPSTAGPGTVKPTVERSVAGRWPDANYYGKDGKVQTGSFSGLFKEIYGTPVTEDLVCRWWGDRSECRSPSTVENFRNRGDIVKGNGDEAPTPATNMSAGQIERLYSTWKDKLLTEGKKIHIYHPENPAIKEATKIVAKSAKK